MENLNDILKTVSLMEWSTNQPIEKNLKKIVKKGWTEILSISNKDRQTIFDQLDGWSLGKTKGFNEHPTATATLLSQQNLGFHRIALPKKNENGHIFRLIDVRHRGNTVSMIDGKASDLVDYRDELIKTVPLLNKTKNPKLRAIVFDVSELNGTSFEVDAYQYGNQTIITTPTGETDSFKDVQDMRNIMSKGNNSKLFIQAIQKLIDSNTP